MKPIKPKIGISEIWHGRDDGMVGRIEDLNVVRGADRALYSCWKATWGERLKILMGEPIVIGVLMEKQPPIFIGVSEDKIPLP